MQERQRRAAPVRVVSLSGTFSPIIFVLARIHRWTRMDGVRTLARRPKKLQKRWSGARIGVDGRLAGVCRRSWSHRMSGPQWPPAGAGMRGMARDIGKQANSRGPGLVRVGGDVGLAGGSVADGRRHAGSGMARSRARARLNCSSQGQRRGRCRVNRRAERVIRPAKAKTRRLRVLVVTIC